MQKLLLTSVSLLTLSIVACTAPANPEGEVPTTEMPVPTDSSASSEMIVESSSSSSVSSASDTSESASSDSSTSEASSVMESTSSSAASEGTSSETSSATSSAASSVEPAARVVEVSVTDWSFAPATITAKKGEVLELKLVGGEGEHSFTSEALNLNISLAPGETKTITIPTDAAGTFSFRCAVPCGPGHSDMKGEIVISE